jgi:hypothetical protein
MTQNTETYIGLLIQIPLVGIFVWFSLKLISTFLQHLTDMRNAYLKNLEDQSREWRVFLEQERKASHEATAHMAQRFADEIRTLGKEIAGINGSP